MTSETIPSLLVGTWNVCRNGSFDRQKHLNDVLVVEAPGTPFILCAQEVTAPAHQQFIEGDLFEWGVWSRNLRPATRGLPDKEAFGVAIYGTGLPSPQAMGLDPSNPRPEKFLWVEVRPSGWPLPLTVCSFHAAPGVGKTESMLSMARWLGATSVPTVIGMDANSPYRDAVHHEDSQYFGDTPAAKNREASLIGPRSQRIHMLEDALRQQLARHGGAITPDSPWALEATLDRDKSDHRSALARYDSVWLSPQVALAVQQDGRSNAVVHHHGLRDGAEPPAKFAPPGGSDHALVTARIRPRVLEPRSENFDVVDHLASNPDALLAGTPVRFNLDILDEELRQLAEPHVESIDSAYIVWSGSGKPKDLEVTSPILNLPHGKIDCDFYRVRDLAKLVLHAATGEDLPRRPAGPHWWIVDGMTLVELSNLGGTG